MDLKTFDPKIKDMLKEEVKFLKQQLDYKSLGNPLTYGIDDDIV